MILILYYASYILSAPFYGVAWVLYGASWIITWTGDFIYDSTSYNLWKTSHRRECAKAGGAL